jgi:predicted transcriptional regulator
MMLDVLQVVKDSEEGPTRIMYRANLSWSICRGILDRLAAKELVKVVSEGGRSRYGITAKGAEVLRAYTTAVNEIED